jgi:hypothetical protein
VNAPQPQEPPRQSPLSEAVEQAADAAVIWCRDVADFAEREADRLSSGNYSFGDLATAPIRLLRISVRNAIKTAGVLSDNLALLSAGQPATVAAERTFSVSVDVPAGGAARLGASALVGRLLNYSIPSAQITLKPDAAAPQAAPSQLTVEVKVGCTGAPSDTYVGILSSGDGAIAQPIQVAIDELGDPLP